jgi:ABC-type nitrate/sulfonate/bicarbonate transport system permease component
MKYDLDKLPAAAEDGAARPAPAPAAPPAAAAAPRGPRRRTGARTGRALTTVLSVVVVLVLWQIAGKTGFFNIQYTSTPSDIASAGKHLISDGELGSNVRVTLVEFLYGFLGAVVVGTPLGMLMGWKLRVRQTLEPALIALYVTPSLAVLPIVVIALGIGQNSKEALVFIEAVITIAINAMAGIRETDPRIIAAARSFCASESAVFGKVLFPSALPMIIAGLRLGAGRGVIAVIVAELYGGTQGVGQLISSYGQNFDIAPLLFLTLLVGVFGYAVSGLLRIAEAAVSSWKG